MSRFEEFQELYSFNRGVMEDDYNDGNAYTLKHKLKTAEGLVSTILYSKVK
jgi:hypothetical protein